MSSDWVDAESGKRSVTGGAIIPKRPNNPWIESWQRRKAVFVVLRIEAQMATDLA